MQGVQIHIKGNLKKSGYQPFIRRVAELSNVQLEPIVVNDGIVIRANGTKSNLAEFIKYCFSGPPEVQIEEFIVKLENKIMLFC